MGEAKRRGSLEERRRLAIKRDKELLARQLGYMDERTKTALLTGLTAFLARISTKNWHIRRGRILEYLDALPAAGIGLEKADPIRVRADEIGWYLFLCEQSLNDPLCMDTSQAQRILPFLVGIGERWLYASKVKGLEQKIDEVLYKYKTAPDGLIFEILVALSYAMSGWDVEFLEQKSTKTPDMVAYKDGKELYIECKRQERRGMYAENERNEFLRLWDAAVPVLLEKHQWIWLKGTFHVEACNLPSDFLARILQETLPIGRGERLIHDSPDATIHARPIDHHAVQRHMEQYRVKMPSSMLSSLLGGDWAPMNSSVTILPIVKASHVVDCEAPVLGAYIEKIGFACGFTREFDSEVAINKKARDVTTHLADAVKQVPKDKPSIIHIAAETLEGKDVERRRTEKIMESIPSFVFGKPVLGVLLHRFQSNQTIDKLFEFDETVERFQVDGVDLNDIPSNVITPTDSEVFNGTHWDLYQ